MIWQHSCWLLGVRCYIVLYHKLVDFICENNLLYQQFIWRLGVTALFYPDLHSHLLNKASWQETIFWNVHFLMPLDSQNTIKISAHTGIDFFIITVVLSFI